MSVSKSTSTLAHKLIKKKNQADIIKQSSSDNITPELFLSKKPNCFSQR